MSNPKNPCAIIFILPCFLLSCARPIRQEILHLPNDEVGKCYYSTQKKQAQGGFVLTFVKSQFVSVLDSLPINGFDFGEAESLRIPISDSSIEFILNENKKNRTFFD